MTSLRFPADGGALLSLGSIMKLGPDGSRTSVLRIRLYLGERAAALPVLFSQSGVLCDLVRCSFPPAVFLMLLTSASPEGDHAAEAGQEDEDQRHRLQSLSTSEDTCTTDEQG